MDELLAGFEGELGIEDKDDLMDFNQNEGAAIAQEVNLLK